MDILLLLLASLVAGVLPMICWAVLVWWFDRYEKEPLHLLLISFLWGVAPAVIIAAVVELVLALVSGYTSEGASTGLAVFNLGVVAPFVEEGVKWIGVLGVFWIAGREIDGPLDGIIYGAMVGFGFAATENVLFFLSSGNAGELFVMIFLRAFLLGFLHAVFGAFSGLGLAFAKYSHSRWTAVLWAVGGYTAAVIFHGAHNIGLVFARQSLFLLPAVLLSYGVGILIIVTLAVGSLIRERQTITRYLQVYVDGGLLTESQLRAAASMKYRLFAEWDALTSLNFGKYRRIARMHTLCAELAFKEKQKQLFGTDLKTDTHIGQLTAEISRISELSARS